MEHAILLVLAGRRCPLCETVSNFMRAVDKISKIGRRSSMRNHQTRRTTERLVDGADVVGVQVDRKACLRLIGIFSQIFTT